MITVKVPASTANLGPGFDCLGLALSLYNTFIFEEIDKDFVINGCPHEFKNKNNLVYTSMLRLFKEVGYTPTGISISMNCEIPISSGLGSSSTCILGGLIGANELAGNPLNDNEILNLATSIEGHPDNLSASLYGGLTISAYRNEIVHVEKFNIPTSLKIYAIIPSFSLLTTLSRNILPEKIKFTDGVFNICSASLLIAALIKNNLTLLNVACTDKLHEQYRSKIIPNFSEIKNKIISLNALGTFLSGAGPTIIALVDKDNINFSKDLGLFLSTLNNSWSIKELSICNDGVLKNKSI